MGVPRLIVKSVSFPVFNNTGLGAVNSTCAGDYSGDFNGDIAIFRLYESALTATEVDDNYQAVAGSNLTVSEVEGSAANVGNQYRYAIGATLKKDSYWSSAEIAATL